MLAQSFKSADDLRISERHKEALMKTLVLLETDKLVHVDPSHMPIGNGPTAFSGHFNMSWWSLERECGTVCCLGGTAELAGGLEDSELEQLSWRLPELYNLFYPGMERPCNVRMKQITTAQAATALRSYLTTGDARWDLAVA